MAYFRLNIMGFPHTPCCAKLELQPFSQRDFSRKYFYFNPIDHSSNKIPVLTAFSSAIPPSIPIQTRHPIYLEIFQPIQLHQPPLTGLSVCVCAGGLRILPKCDTRSHGSEFPSCASFAFRKCGG